jgi:transcription elongation factor Elf1
MRYRINTKKDKYTTCLNCGEKCAKHELDINSECWMCQARFENKMKKVVKNVDYDNKGKAESYYDTLSSKVRRDMLNDAMRYYKVKYKNKTLLIDFLNEKYDLNMTRNIFNNITKPENLKKLGLSWKFELQKLSRIK